MTFDELWFCFTFGESLLYDFRQVVVLLYFRRILDMDDFRRVVVLFYFRQILVVDDFRRDGFQEQNLYISKHSILRGTKM